MANDTDAPNRIRELRERRGLNQAQLANLANVTPSALNKLEKGSRGLDQEWMRRLAPILECDPVDLLPDEDNPQRLTDEERELLEGFRAGNAHEKAMLTGISDVVIPFRGKGKAA